MSIACLRSTRGVCLLVVQQYVAVDTDASVHGLRYNACLSSRTLVVELSDSRPTELRALATVQTNLKLVVRSVYT